MHIIALYKYRHLYRNQNTPLPDLPDLLHPLGYVSSTIVWLYSVRIAIWPGAGSLSVSRLSRLMVSMATLLLGVLWNLCFGGTRKSGSNFSVDSVVLNDLRFVPRRRCIATAWPKPEREQERERERECEPPVLESPLNTRENNFLSAGTEQQIAPSSGSTPVSNIGSAASPVFCHKL